MSEQRPCRLRALPASFAHEQAAARCRPWQVITLEELKALLGCLVYMGIVRMNITHDYWTQATRQSFVADTFTCDRFCDRDALFRPLL